MVLAALQRDAAAQVIVEPSLLQADPDTFMVVRVSGLRAVPWKSYRAMRAAIAAYENYRPILAPDAVFRFALMPPPGTALPPNFALRVRARDGREFPIALDNRELFDLPDLPDLDSEADLVSNLKGARLRIGLLVHTPGVAPEKERLGDVRLRYVINEAIANADDPDARGTCWRTKSRPHCKFVRVSVWHNPRAPAAGAVIVEGERRAALVSSRDPVSPSYKMPLSRDWGNDAVVEFDYRRALARPPTLAEVAIYNGND